MHAVTPELVLRAYAAGVFPMARSRDDPRVYWIDPDLRGILPIDGFHLSRSLRKVIRQGVFEVRCDTDFDQVIDGCAEPAPNREETWINDEIRGHFGELFERGYVHTVECWQGQRLVGGLYGVALGAAFFGESMFSRVSNASKVALAHLVARMKLGGFTLLDTQFITDHLETLGAVEIPRAEYQARLADAMRRRARFYSVLEDSVVVDVLTQSSTHRS